MSVSADVDEEVPKETVGEPGSNLSFPRLRDLTEGDIKLVEGIVASFVDARSLGGRADKEPCEEVRQARVILDIAEEAA